MTVTAVESGVMMGSTCSCKRRGGNLMEAKIDFLINRRVDDILPWSMVCRGLVCHTTRRQIPEDITVITRNLATFEALISVDS